jgi:hypothetical protein
MDLADTLGHLRSKWLATDGDHPKIREPFNGFHMERVKAHLSVPEIIGDKRPRFKQLIIQLRASQDPAVCARCWKAVALGSIPSGTVLCVEQESWPRLGPLSVSELDLSHDRTPSPRGVGVPSTLWHIHGVRGASPIGMGCPRDR